MAPQGVAETSQWSHRILAPSPKKLPYTIYRIAALVRSCVKWPCRSIDLPVKGLGTTALRYVLYLYPLILSVLLRAANAHFPKSNPH